MNSPSSCVPPGPKDHHLSRLYNPSPYPSALASGQAPFFRSSSANDTTWDMKAPISQSRPYVSPDPSPLEERFDHNSGPHLPHPNTFAYRPRDFPYPPPILHERPPEALMHQNNRLYETMPMHSPRYNEDARSRGDDIDPWYNPVLIPQPRQQKKQKGQKKVEGKQPTFLTKLYGDQPEYHHIIRWDETGEAIVIENPEELADKILPVVYRQSRFASFSRQLNIYGFNRKLSLRHVERGICDPDASTWSHPFLKRESSKADILSFKRRVPPRPTQAQKRRLSMPDEGQSPTSSEHSVEFHSPTGAYQHHLLPDVDEERPIFFPHPRDSSFGFQEFRPLPPSEYFAYERQSPASLEFDYSNPNPEDSRRFANPLPQRQLGLSREWDRVEPSHLFHTHPLQEIQDNGPQSAPANTSSFPIPIKVTQQHTRTRSVQGEPPSAMLYSPSSPYNTQSWLIGDVPEPQLKQEADNSPISPTQELYHYYPEPNSKFNSNETSTWARREVLDLPISRLDFLAKDMRLNYSSQSLLNDFGPGSGSQEVNGLAIASQGFSALSPDSPPTISPGIIQSGFSFPSNPKSISPAPAPRAHVSNIAQIRQERRATISSSPYSPRNRLATLPFGVAGGAGSLRTIASRRGSEAPLSGLGLGLKIGEFKIEKEIDEEQALPSASIRFEDIHPFEGILGGEGKGEV
ncbi:uncharacterized protein IL334_004398 [Kwoniella shivajii]|uniref:HSF-type DNA-binding domain-containing protein n=1 Tax=Kwoniella shivajii TaxID=564305 RepID=A0ABZ1D1G8_9TREE|nr:hypothetical protein IL334_004398 [Kwoniella shivajii]